MDASLFPQITIDKTPPATPTTTPPRAAPQPKIDSRAQAAMKRAFSNACMESPPPRTGPKMPPPMPSRPSKKAKEEAPRPIFEGTMLKRSQAPLKILVPGDAAPYVYDRGVYQVGDREELCIKQPPQDQSCGAGAALMLMTHFLEIDSDLTLLDTFWPWYLKASLASQTEVMNALQTHTNLSERGYEARSMFFHSHERIADHSCKRPNITYEGIDNPREALLNKLQQVMTDSQSPIILSITNPLVAGHWILLDEIAESCVYVRDPYSGNAFKLPIEELFENWPPDDEVTIVYLTKE